MWNSILFKKIETKKLNPFTLYIKSIVHAKQKMSETPENKKLYPIPELGTENVTGDRLLFYKFADALIEQQSICFNYENSSYDRRIECMKSKQRLAEAYYNYFCRSNTTYKTSIKTMLKFKKLMDVNMQKNL